MKKVKSLIAIVMLCVLCFSLSACGGINKKDAIGIWSGSYTYNGNSYSVGFSLGSDGSYSKLTYKNGSLSSAESGTYEIKSGKVVLHENGNKDISTSYTYKGGALVNNNHRFTKSK